MSKKEFKNIGMVIGALLVGTIWMYFFFSTNSHLCFESPCISKLPTEVGDETVFLISRSWDGCYIAIDENRQIGWKCPGFFSPLGLTCIDTSKINVRMVFGNRTCLVWRITQEDVQTPFKVEYLEKGYMIRKGSSGNWWMFIEGIGIFGWDCLRWSNEEKIWWQRDCVHDPKEECGRCVSWSDLVLKEYPSYAYNLPGDVNLEVFKGKIRFGTPSENCKEEGNSVSCRIEYETVDGNIFSFNYKMTSLEGNSKPMLLYDRYCLEVV